MQAAYRLMMLICLALGICLSEAQQPCEFPPLMTGSIIMGSLEDDKWPTLTYAYDAINQRTYSSDIEKNFTFDLNLYKEKIMYKINYEDISCEKHPLNSTFTPLSVPEDAVFVSQMVLGTSSVPGQGLLVNNWSGQNTVTENDTISYKITTTDNDCLPVSLLIRINGNGSVAARYYNTTLEVDQCVFIPPSFCKDAKLKDNKDKEKIDFFSIFL